MTDRACVTSITPRGEGLYESTASCHMQNIPLARLHRVIILLVDSTVTRHPGHGEGDPRWHTGYRVAWVVRPFPWSGHVALAGRRGRGDGNRRVASSSDLPRDFSVILFLFCSQDTSYGLATLLPRFCHGPALQVMQSSPPRPRYMPLHPNPAEGPWPPRPRGSTLLRGRPQRECLKSSMNVSRPHLTWARCFVPS